MIGTTLSHYRITEKLGQGGMGEVYRAEDTNLNRQVAIKVLPDIFAGDPERLARFEREAKLLASLNHPNIAAIHGLEEHEGERFLILELVEGQTLAERLHKGLLPVEEAIEVCRQIAEGLEAAHEKGVIHRDLKPANVKVTPEGKVKVLDFGLAKAFQDEPLAADASHLPTLTDQMTHPGVILGTAAYMAPEQAKGKTVDKRADIWAFGCLLYECLTGKRAFQGDTITEIVASILKSDPNWEALPSETPAMVRSVLRRCLQKDPGLRLRDIGDARIEIGESVTSPSESALVSRRYSPLWLGTCAAVILLAGMLFDRLLTKYFSFMPSAPMAKRIIKVEQGLWLDGVRIAGEAQRTNRTAMTISVDGSFIVYSAIGENPDVKARPQLYLRRIDQLEAKPIPGTEGGYSPFLSPDDRWIGFFADRKLMKVPVGGGVPAVLCDVRQPFGFSWGADDQIVYAPREDSGLSRISADGGKPETLTIPDMSKEEYSHRLPYCLPALKGILFTIMRNYYDMQPRVALFEPATRKCRLLLENAADARYVATGHLVFLRQGTMMAVPFDVDELKLTGQPVPAVANVMQALNTGNSNSDTAAGQFSISASGSMAYAPGGIVSDRENSLVWVGQTGKAEPIAPFKASFCAPRLSPDGERIAYRTAGRERQAWVYDLNRGTATRLTSEGYASWMTWTPDGRRLVFCWWKTGWPNVYRQSADGSSPMERLTQGEYYQAPISFSSDGETLALVEYHADSNYDITFLQMHDRKVLPFLNSRFTEWGPEFSPDGRWIAYVTNQSGRNEVYVQAFPVREGKWQISNEGGVEALWSRNGKQLYYRRLDQVWVVDVQTGSGFSASKPRLLYEQPGYEVSSATARGWDISPDGKRFLMVRLDDRKPTPVTEMILVQNWFEELKRLCPTGK